MKTTELEKLSENEMSQIKGGGRWIWINGELIWIDTYDLGGNDSKGI